MEAVSADDEQPGAVMATSALDEHAVALSLPSQQPSVAVAEERQELGEASTDEPSRSPATSLDSASPHTAVGTPDDDSSNTQPPVQISQPTTALSITISSPVTTTPPVKLTPAHFKPSVMLGEGSYSQVYLVQSLVDGQQYAMKVLNKAHLQRHNHSSVAYAEKAALTACVHPNIIRLYHTFQDHTSLYFVLELCDGGDVASLLDEQREGDGEEGGGGLPHALVVYYAAQLLHCLHYLHHTAHIIHRDIKPDNLMLSASGQLKLVDFGTAKLHDSHSAAVSAAKPAAANSPKKDSFVGTAAYVAPEILTSTRPQSCAVDQWSAGCTLYQLLTGRLPFQAASEYLTFQRILSGAQVEWRDGEGAHGGRQLVERLMERDDDRRLGVRAEDWEEVRRMQFFQGVDWERLDEWRVAAVRPPGGGGKKYSVMSEESLVGWRNSVSSVRRFGGTEEKENSEVRLGRPAANVGAVVMSGSNEEERRGEQMHDSMLDNYRNNRLSVQHEGRESESKEQRKDSHSHSLPAPTQHHSASVAYSSAAPPSSFHSHLRAGESLALCSAVRHAARPSLFSCCLPASTAASSSASHLLLTSLGRLLLVNLTTGECLSQRPLSSVRSLHCEQRQGPTAAGACEVLVIESARWQLLDGARSGDWLQTWQQAHSAATGDVVAARTL